MRISDWSADVCSSDLRHNGGKGRRNPFGRRVSDRRKPCRTCPAFGARHHAHGVGGVARMNWRVRAGGLADLDALFGFATMTGGGFTNLPTDRDTLAAKLERSAAAFARPESPPAHALYILALGAVSHCEVIGTAQIYPRVRMRWPLYPYPLWT